MSAVAQLTWQGTTPGADGNTYCLWASCDPGAGVTDRTTQNANRDGAFGARTFGSAGIRKFVLQLKYTNAGTLNAYQSTNRGTTWLQVRSEAIAAPVAGFDLTREYLVEGFADFKLEWVNGGATQAAAWSPNMSMDDQRALS